MNCGMHARNLKSLVMYIHIYLPVSQGSANPWYTMPPTMDGILPSLGRPWLMKVEMVALGEDLPYLPPPFTRYTTSESCCTVNLISRQSSGQLIRIIQIPGIIMLRCPTSLTSAQKRRHGLSLSKLHPLGLSRPVA